MTRAAAGLVAVLLALAGCSSLPAAGPGTDSPTLSPAPVPATSTPPADQRVLAPGLSAAGVADPSRLAAAHHDALAGRSFTLVRNFTVVGSNGTLTRWDRRLEVSKWWEHYYYRRVAESAPSYPVSAYRPRLEAWNDGRNVYFRGVIEGNVTYARQGGNAVLDLSRHDRLLVLYANFETRVTRIDGGYRVVGTRLRDEAALDVPALLDDPRNATFVAVLADDGRVRRYRVAYDASFRNRTVRVTRTARFAAIGETTVARPDWYDEARNATDE